MKLIKLLTIPYTWVSLWLVVSMLISILVLFTPLGESVVQSMADNSPQEPFYHLALVVFMAGVLGSSLQGSRGLYFKLKQNQPKASEFEKKVNIELWLYSIAFRPFKGGILSLIVLSLFNAGFLGFSQTSPNLESFHFQISFGFLVGYGAYDVLKKIDEIIKITFSSSSKDAEPKPGESPSNPPEEFRELTAETEPAKEKPHDAYRVYTGPPPSKEK
jgi:hypothetical protein